MLRGLKSVLSLAIAVLLFLSSCSPVTEPPHIHTFSDAWQFDAENHWHTSSCEHTEQKSDIAVHSDSGNDGNCDVCGHRYYNPAPPQNNDEFLESIGIPSYSGDTYVLLNGGAPNFTEDDYTTTSYEYYSALDALGRCGVTMACVGVDIMPTEERGSIGSVKPTGWHTVKYDIVDGKYLYNRCHLIGFQLTGENANRSNLITGTRYLNMNGMLPFENMIADYVKETGNHVIYRVTPIYDGVNLLAHGVIMEAYSVEDDGEGICFNVFAYNVQPGITINYATGESYLSGATPENSGGETESEETYILNISTKKYHKPTCHYASSMNESNRKEFVGEKEELEADGYSACGTCKP